MCVVPVVAAGPGCGDDLAGEAMDAAAHDGDATSAGTEDGATASPEGSDGAGAPSATWHEDIAPIVVGRCTGCHRPAGIAPYDFTSFETSQPLAEAIANAIESGTMPPFGADETDECTPKFGWKNDLRLSDDEKDLIRAWADDGAPAGDPALAAEIPAAPSTELDDADQRLTMPGSVTIDGTRDQFLCFSLDPELSEDGYLTAIQVRPGNDKIVHHVLIYTDAEGESAELADDNGYFECSGGSIGGALIGAWAPGALPNRLPPNTGMPVPAGARLVMNVHYHPTGLSAEIDDATGIDIVWHDETPALAARLVLVGNIGGGDQLLPGPNDENGVEFRIPAGVKDHTETMHILVPEEQPRIQLFSVGSHMHYVGVDMKIELERANGSSECLLQTPNYAFEWQRSYEYDAELANTPAVQAGDLLKLRCTYDNTMNNPRLAEALGQAGRDAPTDVRLGDETLDEMCLAVFGVVYPNF